MVIGSFAGCISEYNLATHQEETFLFDDEKEMKVGEAVAKQFDEHYELVADVDVNERVQRILDRIVAVCDRKQLVYTIKVVEEDQMNAVSLPGGYIYVFKKLIDKVKSDDELAGVIAHEVGHVAAKHGMKRLQSSYGYMLLQAMAIASQDADVVAGVQTAYLTLMLAYSREDEFQADRLGVKYLKAAGYDPNAMAAFLAELQKEQNRGPLHEVNYWRTHPYIPERIAVVNQEVTGKLEFKDYLNLTGQQ
ncbi:MAG: hypothetical protein A2Z88_03805 [Omnitrophica WOR_2 bacterium GWA2_47_8]|nr:MAG: hypothetical protein A2Z88_03805 [Omnitrophica WOR_2 bacterium GWA2_47_8]